MNKIKLLVIPPRASIPQQAFFMHSTEKQVNTEAFLVNQLVVQVLNLHIYRF